MKSNLLIKTKGKLEDDEEGGEPVSPTGQFFNSKALGVFILAVLESEVPIDDSCAIPQLRDVLLPMNPRFSSIMIFDKKGVRRWKKVDVNLEDHVVVPTFPEGLPIESYDNYLDEYMTKLSLDPFPQTRPLWEVHIFKYPTSKAVGHVIFKLHHALGDGYTLMGALLSCVQRTDDPSLPLTFPSTRTSTKNTSANTSISFISWVPRILSTIFHGVYDFGRTFMKSAFKADETSPIRSGSQGISLHPKFSTVVLSLDHIKLIKAKLGTTVNDVLAGIIFLGVRLYMQEIEKESSNLESTALVMFNTRNINGYKSVEEMNNNMLWGNQYTFLHVDMPELIDHDKSDPLDFVYQTQRQITRLRNSPSVYLTALCLQMLMKLRGPEATAEFIYGTMYKSSFGITNMIGPMEQVALANHPVKGIYFMCCGIPSSLVTTIMSYMQTVTIGFAAEKGFIDSNKLTSCLEKAFAFMYEAAATKSH